MFQRKHAGWAFRFVSLQADNIRMQDVPTHLWASSLTIAVMTMPDDATMTDLMSLARDLLAEHGFFGWIIATKHPQTISGFRILQPNETEDGPDNAILVFSMSFRAMIT